ncbi:hypothetical protein D9M71_340510 [compost metagenome]
MQFESLYEYIDQVYDVQLDKEFLKKEAPSLTYVKLVRTLSFLRIDSTGLTAERLFFEATRSERATCQGGNRPTNDPGTVLMYQLADLHEIIETLIRKSGKTKNAPFDNSQFADDINS